MNLDLIQSKAGLSDPGSLGKIISSSLRYIFATAGIILIFMIISSGYQVMMSRGEPKALQSAQSKLTTSIIGVVILFVSFWLAATIMKFFGINIGLFVFM